MRLIDAEALFKEEREEYRNNACYISTDYEHIFAEIDNAPTVEDKPQGDLISREDALLALTGEIKETDTIETIIARSGRRIKSLPSVNPQPKTGHWIDIMVGDMPAQACDRCNTFYPLAYTGGGHKYCPNCGVKMVELQESEGEG